MGDSSHTIPERSRNIVFSYIFTLVFSSAVLLSPVPAQAGVLSFMSTLFSGKSFTAEKSVQNNTQNMPLLQATVSPDPSYARGGGDITVVGGSALFPDTGPIGSQADVGEDPAGNGQISIYVVRDGDSLGAIAEMYGVSVNTIAWANDIKGGIIIPGQKLIILPVSGLQYAVKKGDTINSIAKKYKSDVGEILTFNGLSEDSEPAVGDIIVIPNGELPAPPASSRPTSKVHGSRNVPNFVGYYMRPISYEEGRKTQGLHGYNGVDIGASTGTAIHAAAVGEVIIVRQSGWNGGYGKYVVIQHGNGTQTLYGHMSSIAVSEGTLVGQSQTIGYVGNTGRSTGPHLHFEVRGAVNPF